MGLERLSTAISVVPSLRALEEAVRPTWEKVPPSKYGPNLFRQTANKKDPERGGSKTHPFQGIELTNPLIFIGSAMAAIRPRFVEHPCHGRMGVDCGRGGACDPAFG